jgi:site-specific DNA recombinase
MNKRAILYTRVSTDEQALRGYSLNDQHEKLKAFCLIHQIEVIQHFQDDHSAKSFDRPAFKKLVEFLKQNKSSTDLLLFIKWDRFSRNAGESYEMLKTLRSFNVEAQATEQPLDLSVPESKLMLALYLASPEVENDRRSLNVSNGMRRAMKEGRWVNMAPKGYDNKRDETNRPIIVPNSDAKYIKKAFEMVASGDTVIEHVRKKLSIEGFVCSKNYFMSLLKNPAYIGKVRISANLTENESIVDAKHESIIDSEIFYQVQDILSGKTARSNMPKHCSSKPELPLRGFLKCPKCGRKLTGSASKGNGGKYYYYHCSKGCNERFKASVANEKFLELLNDIRPKEEVLELYDSILLELLEGNEFDKKENVKKIENEMEKLNSRISNIQDKYADNQISSSDYSSFKLKYESQLREMEQKKKHFFHFSKEIREQLKFSFSLLKELPEIFLKASLDVQQQIIGSIFPGNLQFIENKVRTTEVNAVVSLISSINKPFGRNEKGQFSKFSESPSVVVLSGLEPELF